MEAESEAYKTWDFVSGLEDKFLKKEVKDAMARRER